MKYTYYVKMWCQLWPPSRPLLHCCIYFQLLFTTNWTHTLDSSAFSSLRFTTKLDYCLQYNPQWLKLPMTSGGYQQYKAILPSLGDFSVYLWMATLTVERELLGVGQREVEARCGGLALVLVHGPLVLRPHQDPADSLALLPRHLPDRDKSVSDWKFVGLWLVPWVNVPTIKSQ